MTGVRNVRMFKCCRLSILFGMVKFNIGQKFGLESGGLISWLWVHGSQGQYAHGETYLRLILPLFVPTRLGELFPESMNIDIAGLAQQSQRSPDCWSHGVGLTGHESSKPYIPRIPQISSGFFFCGSHRNSFLVNKRKEEPKVVCLVRVLEQYSLWEKVNWIDSDKRPRGLRKINAFSG